ncbi:membrane protein, virulence factor [Kosmotoga arenicorallina S304]|uniref:Membrane protein, virulence factor n=1 Tax=Kosmotoga arenicorallina S304 TaxID=1453497 RepID=A0A176JZW7_9BACT|nr:lipid II flippase MurJ [Kosmotoga arenicorallina]OAA29707.1 membrane protein, virulence factor [Kosmotoga arenicorallina S304]
MTNGSIAQSIAAGTIVITLLALLSKSLGFIREIIIANLFGTSWRLDAVFIALTPVTTTIGIATGGIIAIFFPIYHGLKLKDPERAKIYAGSLLKLYSIIFLSLGAVFLIFPEIIIKLFAPGFSDEVLDYAARKLMYLSVLPLINGSQALLGALLRAERYFFQYGIAQLIFNFVAIPVIYFGAPYLSEASYVLAMILGNFLVVLLYLRYARKFASFKGDFILPETAQTFKYAFPFMLSASLSTINIVVDKMFVSTLPAGRVSSLQYSTTLLGIISTIVTIFTMTSYTELSEKVAAMDIKGAQERMRKTVTSSLNIAIPLTAWIVVMAEYLIRIVFQRGAFSAESTMLVSAALLGYSALLILRPISTVSSNFLTSTKKVKWVFYVVPISITANAFFDWVLIKPFSHAGVAASTSLVLLISTIIRIHIVKHYGVVFLPISRIFKQIVIVSAVAVAVFFSRNILGSFTWIILGNAAFIILFVVMAFDELKTSYSKIKAFFRKKLK